VDFSGAFRETFETPQVLQQIRKAPFHIHETVSVRVWEEILVRCWISHMPIRALLNRVRSRGFVTEGAQEQFRDESLVEGLLDLSFVCY
jgi:hypothetical protein